MPKILIIDDDKGLLLVISAMLSTVMPDCTIYTAQSGIEGIEKAEGVAPDTILLDINMPNMSGYEVCKKIKAGSKTRHIPVILVTGMHTDSLSRVKGLETGADAFLTKPVTKDELKAQVNVMLRIKRAEDQLRKEKDLLKELVDERTKELRESEEKYRLLIENAREAIYSFNRKQEYMIINSTAAKILGGKPEDFIGKNIFNVMPPDTARQTAEVIKKIYKTGKGINRESFMKIDDKTYWFYSSFQPIMDGRGDIHSVLSISTDISEKKKAEKALRASLKEKEYLLKEIHHRVKNNLQIIISLLNLQAGKIEDKQALEAFKVSKKRIYSMALVHEKLYKSKDFSKIDLKDYVETIIHELFLAYDTTGKISHKINISSIGLNIDTAILCGLIINELVTNSLKHAFPNGKNGDIIVSITLNSDNFYEITVKDNGIGLKPGVDYDSTDSLGLKLVKILTSQLNGEVDIHTNKGTTVRIKFKATPD